MELLPLVHAGATLAMAGVIWFVQIVHYPLFTAVGATAFGDYEKQHVRRTTWVVAPLMLVEAATAAALLIWPPPDAAMGLVVAGFVLLLGTWLSTALVQVPLHRRLEAGFDGDAARALARGNWVRTGLWSVRGVIALALLNPAS